MVLAVGLIEVLLSPLGGGERVVSRSLSSSQSGKQYASAVQAVLREEAPTRRNRIEEKSRTALEVADDYIEAKRKEWGIREHHDLVASVFKTPIGARVKYSVFQEGIPIVGLEIRIRLGRDLSIQAVNNKYVPLEKAQIKSHDFLTGREVLENWQSSLLRPDKTHSRKLDKVLVYLAGNESPELAFVVPGRDRMNRAVQILLRARDGQTLMTSYSRAEF